MRQRALQQEPCGSGAPEVAGALRVGSWLPLHSLEARLCRSPTEGPSGPPAPGGLG